MRCSDVKRVLSQQRDGLDDADAALVQSHMQACPDCNAFAQRQRGIEALLKTSQQTVRPLDTQRVSAGARISTDSIMQAVQQQRQISQQLEVIHEQQRWRVARLRKGGAAVAAITFFTLGSIPLLLLAITLVQTDIMVHLLLLLSNVVDVLYILGQYVQTGLTILTRNSFLLTGAGFVMVLMMGMWLRLMRPPQEA